MARPAWYYAAWGRTAADVTEAADLLTARERQRGLIVCSLQLIALLESALGVWNMRSIIPANPRITQVGLDENDLACDLGIIPCRSTTPMSTRVAVWPLKPLPPECNLLVSCIPWERNHVSWLPAEIHTMATDARNLGMKGVMCPHPSWVAPVNKAFTPTADLVAYNKRVVQSLPRLSL